MALPDVTRNGLVAAFLRLTESAAAGPKASALKRSRARSDLEGGVEEEEGGDGVP